MKKRIYTILTVVCLCIPSVFLHAQIQTNSILNDAFALRELGFEYDTLNKVMSMNASRINEWNKAYKILVNYATEEDTDVQSIINSFDDNKFIDVPNVSELSNNKFEADKVISSIGSMDVTNFAFGITDFLIQRTKTELNIAFFEKFKDEMTKEAYENLQILFPQTSKMLLAIEDQMYYYNNFLQGLRQSFQTDLSRMPIHIRTFIDKHKDKISPEVYHSINIGLITTNSIIENKHPGEILKDIADNLDAVEGMNKTFKTFQDITQIAAIISESFRDEDGGEDYWVSSSKIRQMINDDGLLKTYLGLLFQQIKLDVKNLDIQFDFNSSLSMVLDLIADNWETDGEEVKKLFSNIATQISLTKSSVSRFNETMSRAKSMDERSKRDYNYEIYNAYFDITTSMLDILKNVSDGLTEFAENCELNPTVKGTLQNLFSKENTLKIETNLIANVEKAQKIGVQVSNKQYASAVAETFLLLNNFDKKEEVGKKNKENQWHKFLKYGTFMANLVLADSPEAVTAAIETIAVPPGSYSIKKHSNFSVAVNGYLGVYGGMEFIKGIDDAWNISLTAPVGISFNWKDIGLFVPIIDLGVMANYRLTNNTDISIVPKVQLKHIVAPGLFFEVRPWNKLPLSFGLGAQLGAQIREQNITDDQGNVKSEYIKEGLYWRAGLSIKVDIPIVYLKR